MHPGVQGPWGVYNAAGSYSLCVCVHMRGSEHVMVEEYVYLHIDTIFI